LDSFNRLSPQEQIFYIKGEGVGQVVEQELIQKYEVTIHDEIVEQIDLTVIENNEELLSSLVIEAPLAELNFTVEKILDSFNRLSPQEQIFYIKGEGVGQVVEQELIRALMFQDAIAQNYEQIIEEKEEYVQMKRYFILNDIYKKLIIDTIEVPQEEIEAYYQTNIAEYTTPASRCIQVFWGETERKAKRARKKFARMLKLGDEERMQKIIDKDSKNPNQSILDNQYDNGIVTGIGPDEEFSRMIWDNPIGYLSPVFTSARGDIVFFRITKENPPIVKTLTEMEPRIYGVLKKEKESSQQTSVTNQLFEEYNLEKHPDRIRLKLSVEELFNLADDSARMRRFKDAINYYNQIIEHYPNGTDDYKASFMKAFLIAEEMQNTDLAIDLFKAFLNKYPSGDLNESAQFMIDTLEGNLELEIENETVPVPQE
jgi:TolA-binding protein